MRAGGGGCLHCGSSPLIIRSPHPLPPPPPFSDSLVYRIKDDITYKVQIDRWTGSAWAPYTADDVQLEFVMLDPYVRANLVPGSGPTAGDFSVTFRAPDVYGIFHFRVQYRRPGLTVLSAADQVSVRPFRHDEYPRFLVQAYPYYAAALSTMAAVFVFSILFMYTSDKVVAVEAGKPALKKE